MEAAHGAHVSAEDGCFDGFDVDEVAGDEQEFFACQPVVVFGEDVGHPRQAAGDRVVAEDGVEDRHEVAFTGAEGPVEVGGAGLAFGECAFDGGEGFVEVAG